MPRNKLPIAVKEARGTLRPDRLKAMPPKLAKSIPTPPDHMTKMGKKYFREICQLLEEINVVSHTFVYTIERLARWLEMVRILDAELQSLGSITYHTINKDGSPLHRTYTAFTALAEAESKVGYYLSKCGLTPSDIQNVHAIVDDKIQEDDGLSLFE